MIDERAILQAFDGEQLMEDLTTLAEIGKTADGGVHRVAYDKADMQGRNWVDEQLRAVGMTVYRDTIGNSIATYPGTEPDLPSIVLGSHTDTVPNGGKYDGALGVLAALAAVRALYKTGTRLRHPVEIMNFAAEEATMSGATLGSKAMAGTLKPDVFDQPAWDGRPVRVHLEEAGVTPEEVARSRRQVGSIAAFFELHIEQGGTLERDNIPIGIVTGIVSIKRYAITVNGYANHAGTTPMIDRDDALVRAAPLVVTVRDIAMKYGIVGTCGTLRVSPGAPNVIPGRVEIGVEFRGLNEAVLEQAAGELAQEVEKIGGEFESVSYKPAVISDPRLLDAIESACKAQEVLYRKMPSGAGHDAMCIAAIAPQAMLFVPSHNGVSHSPDEYTEPEHCMLGARILLGALLKLDAQLNNSSQNNE